MQRHLVPAQLSIMKFEPVFLAFDQTENQHLNMKWCDFDNLKLQVFINKLFPHFYHYFFFLC